MNDGFSKMMAVIAVVVLIAIWTIMITEANECSKQGGAYVRGLIWYTCVK